jgi:hypothetical protein
MKNVRNPFIVLLLFLAVVLYSSCSSGNRIGGSSKNCGCGMNRGFVGY